jgi:hypothetical protein
MENIGWVGSFLLAICGLFEAINCWRRGICDSSLMFILSWLIGEVFCLMYVLPKMDYPLIFNYSFNIMFVAVMLKYKLYPKGD